MRALALDVVFFSSSALAFAAITDTAAQQNGSVPATEPVEVRVRLDVGAAATAPLVIVCTAASFDPTELADCRSIEPLQSSAGTARDGSFLSPGGFSPTSAGDVAFNAGSALGVRFNA